MKPILIPMVLLALTANPVFPQVSISNDNGIPDPSAGLDIRFEDKGLLPPRLNTAQRNAIVLPANGLTIFNTDCNDLQYFNGTGWIPVCNAGRMPAPGKITGYLAPCSHSSGIAYTLEQVPGANGYYWTVPRGSVINAGQGTTAITVSFGDISGIICVAAYDDCNRSNVNFLTVTLTDTLQPVVNVKVVTPFACADDSVLFTATTANAGANPVYQWKQDGVPVQGATNSVYRAPVQGRVDCEVTPAESCSVSGSNYLEPGGYAAPNPVTYGEPIHLYCSFVECAMPGTTYHWSNSSGSWQVGGFLTTNGGLDGGLTGATLDSVINPVIEQNEPGYASDVFYLGIDYAPPPGGHRHGWSCVTVLEPKR